MISVVLLAGHGGLGLLCLVALLLRGRWRSGTLLFFCLTGVGLGIALIVLNQSSETWRTTELSSICTVVGASAACAWLIAAVTGAANGRVLVCSLIGVSSSALALAATSRWAAPALFFWVCSSLGIAVLAGRARARGSVWVVLFASDVALAAVLVGTWSDTKDWLLPTELDGWAFYALLLAALLRAGAIPGIGTWGLTTTFGAPALPLLTGSAFALLPIALGPADPWVGAGFFALALGAGIWGIVRRTLLVSIASGSLIAVLLGLALIAPQGLVAAGFAAVLAGAVVASWPAVTAGGVERAILFTVLPIGAAFIALGTGVVVAIEETAVAQDVVDKVPWSLVLVLIPTSVAATLALAVRAARSQANRGVNNEAVGHPKRALALAANRLLLVGALAGVLIPGEWLGLEAAYAQWEPRRAVLVGSAIVLGAAAAFFSSRRPRNVEAATVTPVLVEFSLDPRPGSLPARVLSWVGLLFAVVATGAVAWFTLEGLRLGFL